MKSHLDNLAKINAIRDRRQAKAPQGQGLMDAPAQPAMPDPEAEADLNELQNIVDSAIAEIKATPASEADKRGAINEITEAARAADEAVPAARSDPLPHPEN